MVLQVINSNVMWHEPTQGIHITLGSLLLSIFLGLEIDILLGRT
jgi:ABC-type proline/glycine betaine transport system permease subunit